MDAKSESPAILRQRVFQILEHGRRREPASRVVDWLLIGLVGFLASEFFSTALYNKTFWGTMATAVAVMGLAARPGPARA